MRIERVTYETTEGDGSLRVCAVMESANANVDCHIRFPVYAYVNSTDLTTGMYNIVCSSIFIDIHASEDTYKILLFLLVANLDYRRLNMVRLTFATCRSESCINVRIINDDRVERQIEQFFIALHPYPGSPAGLRVNSRSRVDILDNDGMQSEDTINDQFDGVCTNSLRNICGSGKDSPERSGECKFSTSVCFPI